MKTKFTPGPWKVEQHEKQLEIWSDKHFVAAVEHKLFISATKAGTKQGNAALISAAPEMFEALEHGIKKLMEAYKITAKLETQDHPQGIYLNELVMRLNEDFKNVLKKARGES